MTVYLSICALIFVWVTTTQPGECLTSEQVLFRSTDKTYLSGHVIKTKQTYSETECTMSCAADKSCVSANYKTSGIGEGRCELNNKTVREAPDKERHKSEFIHLTMIKPVSTIMCFTQSSPVY